MYGKVDSGTRDCRLGPMLSDLMSRHDASVHEGSGGHNEGAEPNDDDGRASYRMTLSLQFFPPLGPGTYMACHHIADARIRTATQRSSQTRSVAIPTQNG
eukprot:680038-Prymnesium_polylepis.1